MAVASEPLTVCVVTGSRAEFGIWRPVLRAIRSSPQLQLRLVVTGMHLLKGFGETIRLIESEGFPIDARVPMYEERRDPVRPKAAITAPRCLARGIEGLADAFRKLHAGLVMVLGDRLEMLAAACAALAMRIPIAHLHGGETAPGIWDEQIRHAITKMAHLHFCATRDARQRIIRMGENPARVHVVGAAALDEALTFARDFERMAFGPETLRGALSKGCALLLLHPDSPDEDAQYERAMMAIGALRKVFPRCRVSAIGPNNDPGHAGILRAYRESKKHLDLTLSLPQREFWGRLLTLGVLVGNSSSGIIEAATFGVSVVNIGPRQAGRQRNDNVIDVEWSRPAIERAIRTATRPAFRNRAALRKNHYGDGQAARRIRAVLEAVASRSIGPGKQFFDKS